jgi:hypothetical protein
VRAIKGESEILHRVVGHQTPAELKLHIVPLVLVHLQLVRLDERSEGCLNVALVHCRTDDEYVVTVTAVETLMRDDAGVKRFVKFKKIDVREESADGGTLRNPASLVVPLNTSFVTNYVSELLGQADPALL